MNGVKFTPGFFFSAVGGDGATKFVVNICGHASVGWPLARNMTPIPDDYLDHAGLDNLIIPISVGEPQKLEKEFDYGINVVVHPCLTKRVKKSFPLCPHYVQKLTALSLEWILKECGVKLLEQSFALLGIQKEYPFTCIKGGRDTIENDVIKAAAAAAASLVSEDLSSLRPPLRPAAAFCLGAPCGGDNSNNSNANAPPTLHIPEKLQLHPQTSSSTASTEERRTLVKEVVQEKGIKKGFLSDAKESLYGAEGTKEGCGKKPDPLAHIPESLRKRCLVIDTRNKPSQAIGGKKGGNTSCEREGSARNGYGSSTQLTTRSASAQWLRSPVSPIISGTSEGGAAVKEAVTMRNPIPFSGEQAPSLEVQESSWKGMKIEEKDGKVVVTFQSPEHITSMADVVLEVTSSTIFLDGKAFSLSRPIEPDNVKGKFVKSKKKLIITCPLQS